MTVSSTTRRAGPFNGNGVTTSFPFTFKVFSSTDVAVYKTDTAGTQTLLADNYTVTLNEDQDANPGGSVTYPNAGDLLATGETLDLIGSLAYDQETDLTNVGRFLPQVIENALDKVTILVQQVIERMARMVSFPVGDSATTTLPTATLRANKALIFDASGNVGVSADNYVDQLANVTAQAGIATTKAGAAAASASASSTSATAAEASRDAIDNRIYPGTYAADPTARPDGSALQDGDVYFTDAGIPKAYSAGVWAQIPGASAADLASTADAAKGSSLIGHVPAGTGAVGRSLRDELIRMRRAANIGAPRTFGKVLASVGAATTLKAVVFGDSVAASVVQKLLPTIARTMHNGTGAVPATSTETFLNLGGADLFISGAVGVTSNTTDFARWPTGLTSAFAVGASASYISGGAAPSFTKLQVFYVKEPGAGTFDVVVGGVVVGTVNAANATTELGVFTHAQAAGQATVAINNVTGAAVRIINAHTLDESRSIVDVHQVNVGGLLLTDAMSTANGRALFTQFLANIAPDLVTFEMKETQDAAQFTADLAAWVACLPTGTSKPDVLMIGSTPVAAGEANQRAQNAIIEASAATNEFMYFDGYAPFGSYAGLQAAGWEGDGIHADYKAGAFLAELCYQRMGFTNAAFGRSPMAVNNTVKASNLANGTTVGSSTDGTKNLKFAGEPNFGNDWAIEYPRMIEFKGQTGEVKLKVCDLLAGEDIAGFRNVIPHSARFGADANTYGYVVTVSAGKSTFSLPDTADPNVGMRADLFLQVKGLTTAQLPAPGSGNGFLAFCTDTPRGGRLVYTSGGNWLYVADDVVYA